MNSNNDSLNLNPPIRDNHIKALEYGENQDGIFRNAITQPRKDIYIVISQTKLPIQVTITSMYRDGHQNRISVRGWSPKIDRTDLDGGRFKTTRPRSKFRPNSTVIFFREINHKNAENVQLGGT